MRSKKLLVLTPLILAALAFLGLFFWYRTQVGKADRALLKESYNYGLVEKVLFTPSFPSPFSQGESLGILASSTGRVREKTLRNSQTGERLGEALLLEIVTEDEAGEAQYLDFIIQFSAGEKGESLAPWIFSKAAPADQGSVVPRSSEEAAELFPRGSAWIFVPLLDTKSKLLGLIPTYRTYAGWYYGGREEKLQKFVEGGLRGTSSSPLFVLDIAYRLD